MRFLPAICSSQISSHWSAQAMKRCPLSTMMTPTCVPVQSRPSWLSCKSYSTAVLAALASASCGTTRCPCAGGRGTGLYTKLYTCRALLLPVDFTSFLEYFGCMSQVFFRIAHPVLLLGRCHLRRRLPTQGRWSRWRSRHRAASVRRRHIPRRPRRGWENVSVE